MPDSHDGSTRDGRTDGEPARTRRDVLTGIGTAALAGATGLGLTAGSAAAQSLLTRQLVFEELPDEQLGTDSHFVVVTGRLDDDEASIDPSAVENCDLAEFGPDETRTYRGLVVNRLAQEATGHEREILTNAQETPVQVGSVFVVSSVEQCSGEYVTVDAEAVSEGSAPLGTGTPASGTGEAGGSPIPGFRVTGAVAALAGLVGLARWRDGDTEN